uniref:Uncharacterized protein n=1 Tax=Kalanchoe fedtschenkoi TaxID=63787 RepID=A0A7N0TJG6_KALFE
MAAELVLPANELVVDEGLGYPRAYAKLCRGGSYSSHSNGPPSAFLPYALQPEEAARASEFDRLFPIVDPDATPATNHKLFISLLWKQLDHLGNAGFDPAIFRVDPYGNVVYYHADEASPLAWEVDHWFPCSRGGLPVPSNLRILQWQVCKRKHNKLEFLIPWWDLQVGISVNQFMSIFASSNSDFRHRGFSFLFLEGEGEELNTSETADSHRFPQHYVTSQKKVGLAPAAIVLSRRDRHVTSSILKSLDHNRQSRASSPVVVRKWRTPVFKENAALDMVTDPYQAIAVARDSLTQREEAMKRQLEIQKLDDEVNELKQKNDEDKMSIQELELKLMKSRRRAEKHRRLAEAQSSYRTMLEKMVRDAMHQSVVYRGQVRLNQAATNALNARLEAQKAICDDSERELSRTFKQRDEIEKRARPYLVQARKRTRMDVDETASEAGGNGTIVLSLPSSKPAELNSAKKDSMLERRADTIISSLEDANSKSPPSRVRINPLYEDFCSKAVLSYAEGKARASSVRKQLRVFLEEEQRALLGLPVGVNEEEQLSAIEKNFEESGIHIGQEDQNLLTRIMEGKIATFEQTEKEDDESRWQRGRGNVERWLQMLLENSQAEFEPEIRESHILEGQVNGSKSEEQQEVQKEETTVINRGEEEVNPRAIVQDNNVKNLNAKEKNRASFEWGASNEKKVKGKGLSRSESARSFRFPSSPSIILGMRKGVDCIRKKAMC